MITIFKHGTNYDFVGKAHLWVRISLFTFIVGLLVLIFKGPNFGLDFTGGHELLIEFSKADVHPDAIRAKLDALKLGETSVQKYEESKEKVHYLVRVQRSSALSAEQVAEIEGAYKQQYGQYLKRVRYNPESGDVVEVELTPTASVASGINTSSVAVGSVMVGSGHPVRQVRELGRADDPRFSVVLKGLDEKVVRALQEVDAGARAVRVEFVGPTVGKQLRNDGILAVAYALLAIMIYVALRFDFFFSPGAVICLFHDAVITVALMAALGQEFSLTTIAAILTLVGYSINDTIIVFDRIRETMGNARGAALRDIVNKSTNETLSRTVMTSATVLLSCLCLMVFGRGTVLFQFGLIMFMGVIFGTYSSIYVASPIFIYLRERFGAETVEQTTARKKPGDQPLSASR